MPLSKKFDVNFRFIRFGQVISGIAFKEKEGVIASFKFKVEREPSNLLILKAVLKNSGEEVYNVINEILTKCVRKRPKHVIRKDGHVCLYLELKEDEVREVIEKIEKFLNERRRLGDY